MGRGEGLRLLVGTSLAMNNIGSREKSLCSQMSNESKLFVDSFDTKLIFGSKVVVCENVC